MQCSPTVQNRLSSHEPPSFAGTETHCAFWHWPVVHALACPSSHCPPSFPGCAMQPICGSQAPTVHWPSKNEQSTGELPVHVPLEHVPGWVQRSMSSHCAPSLPGTLMQASLP